MLRTRRAILISPIIGGAMVALPSAEPSGELYNPFGDLAAQVRALCDEGAVLNYEDPREEAAHYAAAAPVMHAVIAARATTLDELRVKALAYRWAGGQAQPYLSDPIAQAVVASLVRDLLLR